MTSVLNENDKIYTMYRQYKELIHKEAEENDNRVYGTDQMASRLVVAHMLDHVVCLLKNEDEEPVKVRKIERNEELEIMRNNANYIENLDSDIPLCR